jgi:hypothetical protein
MGYSDVNMANGNVPAVPPTTAADDAAAARNDGFRNVLRDLGALAGGVARGAVGGETISAVGGLIGALTGGGIGATGDFEAQMARMREQSERLMRQQADLNFESQKYTAATNVAQGAHEAEMAVIRNLKGG